MTLRELADILASMYSSAPNGDKVVMIHLFAIKYADELAALENANMQDLLEAACMPVSYVAEINKGRHLSKYVVSKC
ncbi:MAG: hypothetical protein K2H47_01825 [Muribaculaceae bacterium]|nr:hypothetical protein [Muribaculaceae bacterium]